MKSENDTDGTLRAVVWAIAGTGAVASAVSGLLAGAWALGVVVGVLIALANFWAVTRVVRGMTGGGGSRGLLVALALGKFTLLFGGLYLLFSHQLVDVMAVAVGYGALPLGVVLGQLAPARADA